MEELLQSAPEQPVEGGPVAKGPRTERRCGPLEAQRATALLAQCRPAPEQAVLFIGIGRCQQDGGMRPEAIRSYEHYLGMVDSAGRERVVERRARVQRWLEAMGEAPATTSLLVVESNLRGVSVRELAGYPDGFILNEGQNKIPQPPGARQVLLSLPGFERVDVNLQLRDQEPLRIAVDWRRHLSPRYRGLLAQWDEFVKSGLTPEGFQLRRQRPLSVLVGLLVMGGGGALIGVCAADINGACDAGWKQGLAYGFGVTLGVSGLVSLLGALLAPLPRLPQGGAPAHEAGTPPSAPPPMRGAFY